MSTKQLLQPGLLAAILHIAFTTGAQTLQPVFKHDWGHFWQPFGPTNVVGVGRSYANGSEMSLLSDGFIHRWDGNNHLIPSGAFDAIEVTGGTKHYLALKREGVVFQWGTIERDRVGAHMQANLPMPPGLSNVVSIASGEKHCLALKSDGTVAAWGSNADRQCSIPPGLSNVVSIYAGARNSFALKSDGTVVAWGYCGVRCDFEPGPKVLAILPGLEPFNYRFLRADGSLINYDWWPDNVHYPNRYAWEFVVRSVNQTVALTGIAAGGPFSTLTSDGRLYANDFGYSSYWLPSLTLRPQNLLATNVISLVQDYMGMIGDGQPSIAVPPYNQMPTSPVTFNVIAISPTPATYQWRRDGNDIPDATNNALVITDLDEIDAASEYTVVVSNEFGSVTSKPATLWPKPIPWLVPVPPGTYLGLFQAENDVDFETSGYFQLKLTGRYAFSGFVVHRGVKSSFTGRFARDRARLEIARANLVINLRLNHLVGAESITGTVDGGDWTAELISERSIDSKAVFSKSGSYTMVMPEDENEEGNGSNPDGNSWGILIVKPTGGMIKFAGTLADNSAITQSAPVSRRGRWPLYAQLYKGAGAIQGWVTFTNAESGSFKGNAAWLKTAPSGPYCPAGFTNHLSVVGSTYFPDDIPINATSGEIVFSGGDVSVPLTKQVILSANKIFDVASPSTKPMLTINSKLGTFSGNVQLNSTKKLQVKGVIMQEHVDGAGFFLGTTNTGSVYIQGQ